MPVPWIMEGGGRPTLSRTSDPWVVLTSRGWNFSDEIKELAASLPEVLARPRRILVSTVKQDQRRLNACELAELVANYEDGVAVKDLAEQFGIHRVTVTAQLQRVGVQLRHRGLLEVQIDEACRLYLEGWSLRRLAERFGVTDNTVHARLRERGVPMRRPWERP